MKRTNRLEKFAIFVLVIAIIGMILVSGTFAKYTSSTSGSDSVKVAKWDLVVKASDDTDENGTQIAVAGTPATVSFDLFNTINDTNGAAETDVDTGLIAPGTKGSFSLEVINNSEVTADYTMTFSLTNTSSVPVQFSTDNGTSWTTNLNSLSKTGTLNMKGGTTNTVTVLWKWDYEVNDTQNVNDTTLGILARTAATEDAKPTVEVSAAISATQAD